MPEVRISEIQKELQSPDLANDKLEIMDADGASDGSKETRYIHPENLVASGGAEYYDSGSKYEAGDQILYSSDSQNNNGTYDNNVTDYKLYLVNQDISANVNPDGSPSKFDLVLDLDNIPYSGLNQDEETLDNTQDVLDFLLGYLDIPVVGNNTERSSLDTKGEFRLIYNQKGSGTIDLSGSGRLEYYDHGNSTWQGFILLDESDGGRLTGSTNQTGVITNDEANRLQPDIKQGHNNITNGSYTFNATDYNLYEPVEDDFGKIIKFDANSLPQTGNAILVELPVSSTSSPNPSDVGFHAFFIVINGSNLIKFVDEDNNNNTGTLTSANLQPFDQVDAISGYMSTAYNIRNTGSSNNYWSIIGNIIDGT